jgi:hypothetical protein
VLILYLSPGHASLVVVLLLAKSQENAVDCFLCGTKNVSVDCPLMGKDAKFSNVSSISACHSKIRYVCDVNSPHTDASVGSDPLCVKKTGAGVVV